VKPVLHNGSCRVSTTRHSPFKHSKLRASHYLAGKGPDPWPFWPGNDLLAKIRPFWPGKGRISDSSGRGTVGRDPAEKGSDPVQPAGTLRLRLCFHLPTGREKKNVREREREREFPLKKNSDVEISHQSVGIWVCEVGCECSIFPFSLLQYETIDNDFFFNYFHFFRI
jgi:hypothetical protein